MEMVKKSGIMLILGTLTLSAAMAAADTMAPVAAAAQAAPSILSEIHMPTLKAQWPLINLNNLSKTQVIIAAALLYLPFYLLHNQNNVLPACVRNNFLFQKLIGTPEKDQHKVYRRGQQPDYVPREDSSGLIGKLDSIISRPWEKASKSVTPILAILGFIGMIEFVNNKTH